MAYFHENRFWMLVLRQIGIIARLYELLSYIAYVVIDSLFWTNYKSFRSKLLLTTRCVGEAKMGNLLNNFVI